MIHIGDVDAHVSKISQKWHMYSSWCVTRVQGVDCTAMLLLHQVQSVCVYAIRCKGCMREEY